MENKTEDQSAKKTEDFTEEDSLSEEKAKKSRTLFQSVCFALSNVTVEPTTFLFLVSCIITLQITQNLNLEKACRVNLNFTNEVCTSLKSQQIAGGNEYERAAQRLIASALTWRTYISATTPCMLALFVGSWSDTTGCRKIFVIIPVAGQLLICINNMFHVYFFYELRLEHLVFTESILEGFSGGWCICFLTVFSYISAITTEKTRTFRMGLISFSMTVGLPVGMGLSGILLKKFGYYGCYSIVAGLHTTNLLYNIFILKDPKRTCAQKQHDGKGFKHFMKTFFNFANVKETIRAVFKNGPNQRRIRMIVLLVVLSILFGPMYGEISILYLNTRYRFNWDEVKFSIFQTYNFVTHTVGTIFSITVFSKYLQWHDSILGIISTTSKIAASFIYCFATNEKIFYLAPLVEILNGTSLVAMRSIVSKLVAPDELGKVNSIFGLTENMMPLLYVPLYTKVYTATMESLPGAVFLMGAAMTIPAVVVFSWLLYEHRKQVAKSKAIKIAEPDEGLAEVPLKS